MEVETLTMCLGNQDMGLMLGDWEIGGAKHRLSRVIEDLGLEG